MGKDIEGVKSALASGADPNSYGECTAQFNQACSPAHYVIKRSMAKSFLQALLDAGANIGAVDSPPRDPSGSAYYGAARYKSGEMLDIAVRSNNLSAFEVITEHPRFKEGRPGQPSAWQWGLVFDTQKPHLWLARFLSRWGTPQDEAVVPSLLKTALKRADRRCLSLLLDQGVSLSQYLAMSPVREGCANHQGARVLFDMLLPDDPHALSAFKQSTGKSLLTTLIAKHGLRGGSLAQWLKLPEVVDTLKDPLEQEDLVSACIASGRVRSIGHLVDVGISMPIVQSGELCDAYFGRLGLKPPGSIKPDDLRAREELLNNLWIRAQSDTMKGALPAQPHETARPRNRL
jgi:hypothetical protein